MMGRACATPECTAQVTGRREYCPECRRIRALESHRRSRANRPKRSLRYCGCGARIDRPGPAVRCSACADRRCDGLPPEPIEAPQAPPKPIEAPQPIDTALSSWVPLAARIRHAVIAAAAKDRRIFSIRPDTSWGHTG